MAQQTMLRDLAKAYANGAIDQNTYRKSRNDFFQKIIDGDIKLPVIDYPPPVLPAAEKREDVTERKASRKATEKPPRKPSPETAPPRSPAEPAPPRKRGLFLLIGVTAIMILAGAVFFIMHPQGSPKTPPTTSITSPQTESEPQKLIQAFLRKRSWTASSMNAFVAEWKTFTDEDRLAVKNSVVFGQLTNAIYKKLLEEKALSGIGDSTKSLEKQIQLVHFAEMIGIDDPRIAMPESPGKPADGK